MKYFTKEYVMGELDDTEFDDRLATYLRYRASIWDALPAELRKAIYEVPFHDAKIGVLRHDKAGGEVVLELLCERFEETKATTVALTYRQARLLESAPGVAQEIADNPASELLYCEVEVVGSELEQRFIFAPNGCEFGIRFSSFAVNTA